MTLNLALNAIISGLLLAGVYAIASLGLTITFGLLQIPNVAHPTFIVLGAYCAQLLNSFGLDPIIAGLLFTPLFYLGGVLFYHVYFQTFERRGRSDREPGRDLSEQCLHWHLPITWNAPQPTDAGKATAVRNPVHPRAQADRSGHSAVEGLALLLEEMIVMIIGCMRQGPGCQ